MVQLETLPLRRLRAHCRDGGASVGAWARSSVALRRALAWAPRRCLRRRPCEREKIVPRTKRRAIELDEEEAQWSFSSTAEFEMSSCKHNVKMGGRTNSRRRS